jgi:exosortase/archaeosortase family protein
VAIAFGCLILAGVILFVIGALYMVALERTHALVAIAFTGALGAFLGAALISASLRPRCRLPLNWIACVSILLWLLSVPLPPGSYTALTQGLQAWVTEVVMGLLHLLGVAAVRDGNIIQLVSCIYAGFFFSATIARTGWARVIVIGLAGPLAVAMNVLRSLALTLLAYNGVEIRGAWHDVTGFAVLGVTALLLAGVAFAVGGRSKHAEEAETRRAEAAAPPMLQARAPTAFQVALSAGLMLVVGLLCILFVNTRFAGRPQVAPPVLGAILPAEFTGWTVTPESDELYRFSAQLHTEHLAQRTYAKATATGPLQITVYLAYWPKGKAPVSLVASHTPDACWPGAGWTQRPVDRARVALNVGGRALPEAEHRDFVQGNYPQEVWFWHLHDGRAIHVGEVRSAANLLMLALRYGFREGGDQWFVRVSSNRAWEDFSDEALLKEIFARLEPFGL